MPNPDPILNSKKNKLAKAYLLSLIAKLNYAIAESNSDLDGMGIDYTVYNRLVGSDRTVSSESNELKLQLKAVSITSTSMLQITDQFIKYNLSRKLVPVGPNFYLVVVELLGDDVIDTWIEHTNSSIAIKKCAYYLKITDSINAGFIKIPKENILSPEVFPSLFIGPSNQENLI